MRLPLLIAAFLWVPVASAQLLVPQETDSLQADAVEYGIPVPPTADEVKALSPELFEQQATAIKRVLLLQQLQYIEDGYVVTEGNRMASAFLAIKLKAPAAFCELMQVAAAGELSARRHRVLSRCFDRLYELYRVDALAIRLFAESDLATLVELSDMAAQLPMASIFNLAKPESMTLARAEADLQEAARAMAEITTLYAGITNAEQAAAAVPMARNLVARFAQVYPGLALAPDSIRNHLAANYTLSIKPLLPALIAQRHRLREENFYGSIPLKVLDYFLD